MADERGLCIMQVTARDRPEEPLLGKSATGCWTGVSWPVHMLPLM